MKLAIASGKGGTGKTMLSAAIARSLATGPGGGPEPLLLDCDVEAPDLHLFLTPVVDVRETVRVPVPEVDAGRCSLCGECARACRFNAIGILAGAVRVFPALCHGCGTCSLVCPEAAIIERGRPIGLLESGRADGVRLAHGVLNVGEAMAVPVIRRLKERFRWDESGWTILDAPPGTSCPVVETLAGADYVILVTEPTPFGVHDLALAVELVHALGLQAGVVVNRDDGSRSEMDALCAEAELPILLRIPFSRKVAEGIARGRTLVDIQPEYGARLREMVAAIERSLLSPFPVTRPVPGIAGGTARGDG